MRLKATCLLLLFLLVGFQASAATCAVRCEMESMASPSHLAAMAHCSGMTVASNPNQEKVAASTFSQPCDSHLCDADWMFLQNQDVHDLSIASLPASLAGNRIVPIPMASGLKLEVNRRTSSIPPPHPFGSILRI